MNSARPNSALPRGGRSDVSEPKRTPRLQERVAVLESMRELVAEHGFHGVPMAPVAELSCADMTTRGARDD
jgi:hypothetical protein